jgi:hypothetical protein
VKPVVEAVVNDIGADNCLALIGWAELLGPKNAKISVPLVFKGVKLKNDIRSEWKQFNGVLSEKWKLFDRDDLYLSYMGKGGDEVVQD